MFNEQSKERICQEVKDQDRRARQLSFAEQFNCLYMWKKKNTKKGGNQNKKSVKYSEAELQKKNTNREEVLKTQIEEEQKT